MSKICQWPDGCENYCEGTTDYCGTHNHQMRKAARIALIPKKVYEIPKMSPKMKKAIPVYSKKKKIHLEKHPDCQIRLMGICQNDRSTNTIHHSEKRGKNLTNEETFLTACVPCHEFIETRMSASERREKGFLK